MIGISNVRFLGLLAVLITFTSTALSGKGAFPSIDDCKISNLRLGATRAEVEALRPYPNSRRDLGDGRFELKWNDGIGACFDAKSQVATKIFGTTLEVDGRTIVKKGMNSSIVMDRLNAKYWPAPFINGPESNSWVRTPPAKLDYCDLRYQLEGGYCSVILSKDKVQATVIEVEHKP